MVLIAVAVIGGMVRGITGFDGAMVMVPPLTLLLGPKITVPVVLLLESLAATPQIVKTRVLVRSLGASSAPMLSVRNLPHGALGGYWLATAEPHLIRRPTALVVIVFSLLLLLRGWRYTGAQKMLTGIGLGGLVGATSIGGPPVILYLLAGPDRIEITRANLTLFVAGSCLLGFVVLWARAALTLPACRRSCCSRRAMAGSPRARGSSRVSTTSGFAASRSL